MSWHANIRVLKEALYFVVWVMSLEPHPLKFTDLKFSIMLMASVYVSRESLQQQMHSFEISSGMGNFMSMR